MAKAKKSVLGRTLADYLPWILLIGGLGGLFASFMLSLEKFEALKNPHYVPVCNLNPILNCGTVASSDQAFAFGFYNPFLGLVAYSAVVTVGASLLAGAKFRRWFWVLLEAGLLFGVLFITWLQFETLYRIGALCLFCMVAWAVTIPVFWYATLYNLREGNIILPKSLKSIGIFAQKHHGDILLVWFLIILLLILKRFWYYWSTLI